MIQDKFPNIEFNKSLKELNTFKVGGSAKYFLEIFSIEELSKCIEYCKENNIKFFLLGWGSNVLISDDGFDGLIIKIINNNIKLENGVFYVDAGVMLFNFLQYSLDNGYVGAEFLAGIPGTIGGAIYGNAGTSNCISDILDSVLCVCKNGEIKEIKKDDCDFSYRNSIFKKNNCIVYSAKIILKTGDVEESRKAIVEKIKERNEKQPLEYPNAGSFFKNIDLNEDIREKLKDLDISAFLKSGKIPAGFLIDNVGLKEYKVGGAMVSEKHANFLINFDNAKAIDIYNLAEHVKKVIFDKFGINLHEEVQFIGFYI